MSNKLNIEAQELVIEIMVLGFLVNQNTDFCTFVDFSGHVNHLRIDIRKSKSLYTEELCDTQFYIDKLDEYEKQDDLKWLKVKRDHLKSILDTNDIPYEELTVKHTNYVYEF